MDKNRLWVIGSVLVMVALVALGWMLGIQPQLSAAATSVVDRVAVQEVNRVHEESLAKLKKDFTDIDRLNDELASLSRSVPFGAEVPDYVDQLDALASTHHVTITGLTVADAAAYTPVPLVAPAVPAAPPAAPGSAPASTPTPTPTPAATEAPADLVPAPGAPPITNAKITAENFASLGVQITVTGSYNDVLNFVNGLQTGTRLFLVTGLATAAEEQAPPAGQQAAAGSGSSTTSVEDGDNENTKPSAAANVEGTISGLIYSIVTKDAQEDASTK